MFDLRENVVYPGHGVAQINRIIEKRVAGILTTFYELSFINKDVTVLVPTSNSENVGLRSLSSENSIDDVFKTLAQPARKIDNHEFTASSWNRRNKGYQLKLRTGSLSELSEIYRDLRFIGTQKPLSFGEKNLLSQTEALLVEEISIVRELGIDQTIEKLRSSCFTNSPGLEVHREGKRI
jgi:CarD family transcriptional regulator